MFGIYGSWYLDLAINGQPFPVTTNTLCSLEIVNNIHQHLPSFYLKFDDDSGEIIDSFGVGDGTPVTMSLGVPGIHIYENLTFKVLGAPLGMPRHKTYTIELKGVLDNIEYQRKVVDKPVEGNSSDVISQWASEAGLTADVDSTSDKQVWLPNRTSIADYLKHVAERGWASKQSTMLLAVTDEKKLRYKDLDKIVQGSSTRALSEDQNYGDIPLLAYEVKSKTHVANASRAYGATTMSTNEKGEIIELNKVDVRKLANNFGFSSDISSSIGDLGNRVTQLPLLSGNTHEKWNDAIHQNRRGKSAYAFDIEVLTDYPTQMQLLDLIGFAPINRATNKPVKSLTGDYIITALTRYMDKRGYFEKLTLTSNGPNS